MNKMIQVCPSTLKEGFDSFSPTAVRKFLGGKRVSPILPFESLSSGEAFVENKGRLSLSGAQEKYSAVIDKGVFRLTEKGERGTYILKPKLTGFDNRDFSPANENLTMQIASQVYGIETAENAVCLPATESRSMSPKGLISEATGAKSTRRTWLPWPVSLKRHTAGITSTTPWTMSI